MAEPSTMDSILGWLRGSSAPTVTTNFAPQLPAYPSQHDADYARNYGFGDNNINEDYLNNQKARVLGSNMDFSEPKKGKIAANREVFVPASGAGLRTSEVVDPARSSVVDLNKNNGLQGQLSNTMMQAALAANRSPIASVGFDPSKVVVDSLMQHGALGGLYRPGEDTIYTTLNPDDSIVHESTHRGIQKLREKFPEQTSALLKDMPDEEMVVRWLMSSKGGDPEGFAGKNDSKQRKESIEYFSEPEKWASRAKNVDNLKQLEELAIQVMQSRGKRAGPQ